MIIVVKKRKTHTHTHLQIITTIIHTFTTENQKLDQPDSFTPFSKGNSWSVICFSSSWNLFCSWYMRYLTCNTGYHYSVAPLLFLSLYSCSTPTHRRQKPSTTIIQLLSFVKNCAHNFFWELYSFLWTVMSTYGSNAFCRDPTHIWTNTFRDHLKTTFNEFAP